MAEVKNIPEIRFKSFIDCWDEKLLGEVVSITMGQSPNGENYTDDPSDHILVQGNADMKNGMVSPRLWTKQVTKTAQAGDIIFSVRAPVGDVGKTTFDVVIGRGVASLKGNEFIFQTLHKLNMLGFWKKLSAGSTFDSINSLDLASVKLSNPTLEEQIQIGTFFKNLDAQITLKQRKLDKLVTLKKAMLEKMFPKDGADKPEIRFKGFSGGWNSELLDANADFAKGQGYSKSDLVEAGTPIVLYGRLYTKYESFISKVDTFVNAKPGSLFSKGCEVVVPASGETAEDIARASAILKEGVLLGGDLNIIYPNEKFTSVFLALSLSNGKVQKDLSKRAQGKSVVHVRNSDIKELEISFPSIEEQKAIGAYFAKLDDLISLQKTELTKLKKIKSSCLEKMFV